MTIFLKVKAGRYQQFLRSGAFTLGNNFEEASDQPIQEVNNLEACNWAVRKELLVKVGGFDPAYTGIGEGNEPDARSKSSPSEKN